MKKGKTSNTKKPDESRSLESITLKKGKLIMIKISVVVCAFHEWPNVEPLIGRINDTLEDLDYKIIYVDDESADDTVNRIKNLNHPLLTLDVLKKNYDQSSALSAEIQQAMGGIYYSLSPVLFTRSDSGQSE